MNTTKSTPDSLATSQLCTGHSRRRRVCAGFQLGSAALAAALSLACGCHRDPQAAKSAPEPGAIAERSIFAWRPALAPADVLRLDPRQAPHTRLVPARGETNLMRLDAILTQVSGLAPRSEAEPVQAEVVRILVHRRLALPAQQPAAVAELRWLLEDAVTAAERAAIQASMASATPGTGAMTVSLGLEHRAELLGQVGESYLWLAANTNGSVLPRLVELASVHATLATNCWAAAALIQDAAGRAQGVQTNATALRKFGSAAWQSPFEDAPGTAPAFRAFASELRPRLAELRQWIPAAPQTNGAVASADPRIPSTWFGRFAMERQHLPELRSAIVATSEAWRARVVSCTAVSTNGAANPAAGLLEALADTCAADMADLLELERRCQKVAPEGLSADLRIAYREVALVARQAALSLERAEAALRAAAGRRGQPSGTSPSRHTPAPGQSGSTSAA